VEPPANFQPHHFLNLQHPRWSIGPQSQFLVTGRFYLKIQKKYLQKMVSPFKAPVVRGHASPHTIPLMASTPSLPFLVNSHIWYTD